MIPIAFEYKVISVDNGLKLMEVEYSAPTFENVVVSMPIPFDDFPLEDYMRSYAPVSTWITPLKTHREIEVGATGTVEPPGKEAPPPEVQALAVDPIKLELQKPEQPSIAMNEMDVLKMIEALKLPPQP